MKFRSIKFIATALISILGIITISVFSYFAYINTKASLDRKYNNEAELVLKHTSRVFKNQVDGIEGMLAYLSESATIKNADKIKDDRRLISLLEIHRRVIPSSRLLQVGLEEGRMFMGPVIDIPLGYNHKNTKWYAMAKKAPEKVIWTEPYIDYITRKMTITAAKAISSAPGKVVGVISVDLDVSEISRIIGSSSIGLKGYLMLLSNDGTVVVNKDNYLIGERPLGNKLISLNIGKKTGSFEDTIKGKKYYIYYDTMEKNGVYLVAAISREEIDENLRRANFPILITGIICLLLFCFSTYFIALRAITPLQRLVQLMRKAEEGDYNVSAHLKGYDEIASLARSFNSMIEGIRKRDEELTASYKELTAAEEALKLQYEELQNSQKVLEESEGKIRKLAYYDSLTGLLNREKLLLTLTGCIEEARMHDMGGAVIYVDIDNFKTINDTMGHTFGDKVLVEIAGRFAQKTHFEKKVARIGGDEFIILLSGVDCIEKTIDESENLAKVFESPVIVDSISFNLTASIGVSLYPEHGTTVEELLRKADMAMYRAKENGKNCYKIFDESMQMEIIAKSNIERGLREALKNNGFTLYYQPQYGLSDRRIHGLEALLRWSSPTLGQVSPLKFIKIAEETGLIIQMEKWVLRNACMFAKDINKGNGKIIKVSVNISVVHIMQCYFVRDVLDIIEEIGVNPEFIELEITETAMMESFDSNKMKLEELRKLGINIHLDDFGSGYSSLNYLQNLPIDYVKIDKAFVDSMLNSVRDGKITATIVELAHNIGLRVVAEGVENKEQLDLLAEYNCDIIQGYYFCKPIPADEVIKLLNHDV